MTRISAITPRRGGVDRRQFAAGAAALGLVSRPAIAATKLKIGLILPMSGYLAEIGQDDKRGEVLAGRVLPGMGYEPFEVVVGDTESKPEIARAVAEKLVNDGCHILIGAFDSGQTIAAVQVAEQKGIPFIVHIGAAPQGLFGALRENILARCQRIFDNLAHRPRAGAACQKWTPRA